MIDKIKKLIIKSKDFIKDMSINTFSFGIYIIAQQIILMPIMSRILNQQDYANYIIYISVFAIITNVFGSELGVVRQVRKDIDNGSDYNRILLVLLPIIIGVSLIVLYLLNYGIIDIIFFVITIIFANIRLYSASYFRMKKDFKKVLLQNIIYFIGVVIGLLLYRHITFVWFPTLLAELGTLIYSLFNTDITKTGTKKTENNKIISRTFINLGLISLLVNGIVYFDKILIYPILGDGAVTLYYSTSSMSKVINLIINPLYSVILSWLKDNENFKTKLLSLTIKSNIPMLICTFIISLPLTYISLKILYPQYFEASQFLIIPICIGLTFSVVSSLVKAILLKYMESKKLLKAYIIYFAIFIISALVMSKFMGLIGFAYSNVISKFSLWIIFLVLLKKCSQNTKEGMVN